MIFEAIIMRWDYIVDSRLWQVTWWYLVVNFELADKNVLEFRAITRCDFKRDERKERGACRVHASPGSYRRALHVTSETPISFKDTTTTTTTRWINIWSVLCLGRYRRPAVAQVLNRAWFNLSVVNKKSSFFKQLNNLARNLKGQL